MNINENICFKSLNIFRVEVIYKHEIVFVPNQDFQTNYNFHA